MGPVTISLLVDPNAKAGRFTVASSMSEAGGGIGVGTLVLPSGERMPLAGKVFTVGRLPECSIPLNDSNVSRRHAEFRASGRNFVVADLGSTNGTKVNGTRIAGEQILKDGDIISFGGTHIRFEAS
jgi:pSer/pThr/pTyr-binding forkhead associated (FHA) protein